MQILVVEEKFRQKGQILTVDWIFIAVDLEDCNFRLFISVDLIARRVEEGTDLGVALEFAFEGEETEAEIAYIEAIEVVVVNRIRTEVPGISGIFTELEAEDSLELGNFLMREKFGVVHAEVRVVVGVHVASGILMAGVFVDFDGGGLDAGVGDPVIVALVEVFVVDVVAVGILISGLGSVIIYN